jgi:5'-methylthioadenosine phosphorylase
MSEQKVVLGVVGGSGVYQIDGLEVVKEHKITTPFGDPSDAIIEGSLNNRSVYFLPRHGRGHRFTPSEVNYRANIYALKALGVTHLLSVSAVGIMRESIKPGDMIIPDQIFDRTKGVRASTFFGEGVVGHVQFADPFSHEMMDLIERCTRKNTPNVHRGGAIVVMEGPQFSTRAESNFYRQTINPVAIGMTALPEAKLAREAEMAYGLLAMATDYDCWKEDEEDVSVEAVVAVLKKNASLASAIVKEIALQAPKTSSDPCLSAAKFAVMTQPNLIPPATRERLELLYGKYFDR